MQLRGLPQLNTYLRLPNPDTIYGTSFWYTVTPILFRVKPLDEPVEGLSRSRHGHFVPRSPVQSVDVERGTDELGLVYAKSRRARNFEGLTDPLRAG